MENVDKYDVSNTNSVAGNDVTFDQKDKEEETIEIVNLRGMKRIRSCQFQQAGKRRRVQEQPDLEWGVRIAPDIVNKNMFLFSKNQQISAILQLKMKQLILKTISVSEIIST